MDIYVEHKSEMLDSLKVDDDDISCVAQERLPSHDDDIGTAYENQNRENEHDDDKNVKGKEKLVHEGHESEYVAYAYAVQGHKEAMKNMKKLNVHAYEYLNKLDKRCWTKSHFTTKTKCDLIYTNISEASKEFIVKARNKPIITMMEMIRRLMQERFIKKKAVVMNWEDDVCPNIVANLEEVKKNSRGSCIAHFRAPNKYEVDASLGYFAVRIGEKTCVCSVGNLTCISCVHAIQYLQEARINTLDVIYACYKKDRDVETYMGDVNSILDSRIRHKTRFDKVLHPEMKRRGLEDLKNKVEKQLMN
ncbi:uncharacterized protein A4U43_C02F13480 [Asparagus officinalis]|uniref:SWIM-type domain-containing protein n=1 Tax=Asparagus officinalis TaxID=4686 RepID=A0A5P1FIU7_ASPOF|nr:uncharacterized protein A4U43_C02F13480 [Asparagus officinalis]